MKLFYVFFVIGSIKLFAGACPNNQGGCTPPGCGTSCPYYTCQSYALTNVNVNKLPFSVPTTDIPGGACDIAGVPQFTHLPQSYSGGVLNKIPKMININGVYKLCSLHTTSAAACPPPTTPAP